LWWRKSLFAIVISNRGRPRDFISAFRLFDAEPPECRENNKRARMEVVAHDYSQQAFDVQVAATINKLKLAK